MTIVPTTNAPIYFNYDNTDTFASRYTCRINNINVDTDQRIIEENYPGDTFEVYMPNCIDLPSSTFINTSEQKEEMSYILLDQQCFRRPDEENDLNQLPVLCKRLEAICRMRCATGASLADGCYTTVDQFTSDENRIRRNVAEAFRNIPVVDHVFVTFVKTTEMSNPVNIVEVLLNQGEVLGSGCVIANKPTTIVCKPFILTPTERVKVLLRIHYNHFLNHIFEGCAPNSILEGSDVSLRSFRFDIILDRVSEILNVYTVDEPTELPEENFLDVTE